jgi:Ribonuclease G/E
LIYEDFDLVLRMLRDYFSEGVRSRRLKEEFKRSAFCPIVHGRVAHTVQFYKEKSPFSRRRGSRKIDRLYSNKVFLKSSAYVVHRADRGLTVIDVNSEIPWRKISGRDGVRRQRVRARSRDAEAARRRRIVMIDFIDMMEGIAAIP